MVERWKEQVGISIYENIGNSRDYYLGAEHKQGVGTKWFEIVT